MALDPTRREKLIQQYADGPKRLRGALAGTAAGAMKWRPAPEKWSVHEVICHCADSESNAYARVRYLLAEKEPLLIGYDQARWAVVLDYHNHPLEPALATIEAVRANTVALLRRLPEDAWQRGGRHTEIGPITVEEWLPIYAEHLEIHARQIERNLEAWSKR